MFVAVVIRTLIPIQKSHVQLLRLAKRVLNSAGNGVVIDGEHDCGNAKRHQACYIMHKYSIIMNEEHILSLIKL